MEPFVGQIQAFGFNFAPRGWAFCDGQMMSISQNTALFSLLGTVYGGDGRTTFGLPDLRGRVSLHQGTGPGLSHYNIGQRGGVESVTLTQAQMPAHNHAVQCVSSNGNVASPVGALPAAEVAAGADIWSNAAANGQMAATMIASAGGSQPHSNIQPYLVLNWCIALQGLYPSRN